MNTVVMTMGEGQTDQLKERLTPYQVTSKNPYVTFAAKYQGVLVQLYTSGKIVFQGSQAEVVAQTFGYQKTVKPVTDAKVGPLLSMIGTDEVGNGSYFGGIAVVATYLRSEDFPLLRQLGVDDSKQLSDDKIRQIAPILKQKLPHQALLLEPSKYNQLVGPNKPYNAVSVKVALHNQAIFLLLQKGFDPEKIVIDAFTSVKNYQHYLKQEKNQVKQAVTLEEKAEGKYLAVAVSSILARQLFLDNLDQLGQAIGFQLPSGAGAKSDQVASHILAQKGLAGLEMTAKLHFANTQKAQKLLKHKGLL
ncbi:ribonuclease HIII [Streptococcus cuniculipharyngis]|uniref:Ribonuclease HIII n=1 Tax=Streptococcus cuniculipharyngis TaxID=1562651 RepID=A0A5C5SDE7_9STRE|nr:ribonuclease HIII [Streptococcus cuniculipharyngis]TWS98200.1 ribonuclease HIII [Streptococcus cuniculipharyngis]